MRLNNSVEIEALDGQTIRFDNEGIAVWLDYSGSDEGAWMDFRNGRIVVSNPNDEILRKMHMIAGKLGAKVLGDEGEEYGVDGGDALAGIGFTRR